MDVADPQRGPGWWLRTAAFLGLLGAAALALPVSAYMVEALRDRAENWILPVQLVGMVALGAAVGAAVRRFGSTSPARTVLLWAAAGLGAALLADAVWFVLLAG